MSSVAWKGDVARIGGAVPAIVVVWILHPVTSSGQDFPFGGRIGGVGRRDAWISGVGRKGGISRDGAVARKGGATWNRKSSVAWKGDITRIGGAVPAVVVVWVSVTVWVLMSEVKLGRSENGERDKGESESKFHRWGCLVAAVSSSLVCWSILPRSLAPLYAHRGRNNIFGGAVDNLWRGGLSRAQFKSSLRAGLRNWPSPHPSS